MFDYTWPTLPNFKTYTQHHLMNTTERPWLLAQVHEWIMDPRAERIFLLTGAPGTGKTVLTSNLFQIAQGERQPPAELHALIPGVLDAAFFCSAHDLKWINPYVFTESLACQLAARHLVFAQALLERATNNRIHVEVRQKVRAMPGSQVIGVLIKRIDIERLIAEDAFMLTVREPLEALCTSNPNVLVIILVDALDEAALYTGKQGVIPLLSRAEHMPKQVRFIVTARPDSITLEELRRCGVRECSLSSRAGLDRSLADIRKHIICLLADNSALSERLDGVTAETFAAAVGEKSEGNFLYVHYLLQRLFEDGVPLSIATLESQPTGLDAIYREFISRLTEGGPKKRLSWVQAYAPVLGTLAVAQSALSQDQLSEYTRLSQQKVHGILEHFLQFLDPTGASEGKFRLFHRSFAEFLLDADRSHMYWCDPVEYHNRIATFYLKTHARDWKSCDEYGLNHFAIHLAVAYRQHLRFRVVQELKELSDFLLLRSPLAADAVTHCALLIAQALPSKPTAIPLAQWARANWEAYYYPEKALAFYKQALLYYRDSKDRVSVGRLLSNLVNVSAQLSHYPEAHASYSEARSLLEAAGPDGEQFLLALELNYCSLLIDLGDFGPAIASYDSGVELAVRLQDPVALAELQVNRGNIHFYLNEFEASEQLYLAAQKVAVAHGQRLTNARIDRNLGEVYIELHRFRDAADRLQSAHEQFVEQENEMERRQVEEIQSRLISTHHHPSVEDDLPSL